MDESRDSHGCGKSYCCCGNLNGSNPECERCRLIAEIGYLKRCLKHLKEMGYPVTAVMQIQLIRKEIVSE